MKIKVSSVVLILVLLISIFPIINIGSFTMPILYLFYPIGLIILVLLIFNKIEMLKILKILTVFFVLIVIEIIISALNGTMLLYDKFIFPTDSIQYITRFLCIITFIVLVYYNKFEYKQFIKFFLIILNIAMFIGILQLIPWSGRIFLLKLYPFRDGLEQLMQVHRPLHLIRIHGIAQHATANGGLAMFTFVFGFCIKKYYKKHNFWCYILMATSIINVFISQARAGILSLIFSFVCMYFIDLKVNKKSIKPTIYFLSILFVSFFTIKYLYESGNAVVNQMVFRWNDLLNSDDNGGGGARIAQWNYFLGLFNYLSQYVLGLSKFFINNSLHSYGIEIEFLNIFVTYGISGLLLQYGLVVFLLIYFIKRIKIKIDASVLSLLIASFVSLLSYQVFSVGYFFFREVRIGLFPWILMGVTIGAYERYIREKSDESDSCI